jgi:hypothetical protein
MENHGLAEQSTTERRPGLSGQQMVGARERTLRLVTATPGAAHRTLTREPEACSRSCSAAVKTALASLDCGHALGRLGPTSAGGGGGSCKVEWWVGTTNQAVEE